MNMEVCKKKSYTGYLKKSLEEKKLPEHRLFKKVTL